MEQIEFPQYSFAQLIEPAVVQAAADRIARCNLPRRICRPLDRRMHVPVSAEVAAYDATVEASSVDDE